jgi:hypothetical protein
MCRILTRGVDAVGSRLVTESRLVRSFRVAFVPTVRTRACWSENEPVPTDWAAVSFTAATVAAPESLTELLAAFRNAVAGAAVATFRVTGLTPTLRRWLTEDHGDQFPYVSRLLGSSALGEALPDLVRVRYPGSSDREDPEFDWLHPLYLAASLTLQLSSESAYDSGPTLATAKSLVDTYVDELIQGRFDEFHVADSNEAWSDWFYDVVPTWDRTWVITDLQNALVTLACVTDTD